MAPQQAAIELRFVDATCLWFAPSDSTNTAAEMLYGIAAAATIAVR